MVFVGHCHVDVLQGEVFSYLLLLPICWWLTADSPGSECDRLPVAGAGSQSEYEVLAAWHQMVVSCRDPGDTACQCRDCRDCPLSGIITNQHCTAALGFNSDCLHTVQYWGQRTCHVPGVDTFYECARVAELSSRVVY